MVLEVLSKALFKLPLAHVSEVALDCRRRRHHGTDEMRAAATPLAPFEVAIARRCATLARLQNVGIHSQAHRAASFTPFKTCRAEDAIQTFALRCSLHFL